MERHFNEDKDGGIGLELEESVDGKLMIVSIKFGSPAHFSFRLAINDELLEVDGVPCSSIQHVRPC